MLEQNTPVLRPQFRSAGTDVFRSARRRALSAVNTTMLEACWNLGRLIVEEEQQGKARAEYAAYLICDLAKRLTREFGRDYSEANPRNFRQFFLAFPADQSEAIRYTLSSELTGSYHCAPERPGIRSATLHEATFEQAIIGRLHKSMLELGKALAFVGLPVVAERGR